MNQIEELESLKKTIEELLKTLSTVAATTLIYTRIDGDLYTLPILKVEANDSGDGIIIFVDGLLDVKVRDSKMFLMGKREGRAALQAELRELLNVPRVED